jgi:transcriptional regulator with XRE-family HTH domain
MIEPFYRQLGLRLQELRGRRGLTQEQLGSLLEPKTTRASIANIENGKQRVLTHTLVQLARALKVSVAELVGDGEQPHVEAGAFARELQQLGLSNESLNEFVSQVLGSQK